MNSSHSLKVRTLYKTILRLHRSLPPEVRDLGTNYAKDEFRRHKTCSKQQADVFLIEWTKYAVTLANQVGFTNRDGQLIGSDLSENDLSNLSDQQIHQLYELLTASSAVKHGN